MKDLGSSLVVIVATALLAVGCGSGDDTPAETVRPEAPPTISTPEPTVTVETTATRAAATGEPLTGSERRRVRWIAARLEDAIARFDRRVAGCGGSHSACIDEAWRVIVIDAEWPLHYLVPMRPRARGCAALAAATAQLDGFNLGGRQMDYGPPGEAGPSQSSARLALVDALRPLPEELREAAASSCSR